KTRLIGLAQHRHRQQLIRIDDESVAPLDGKATEQLLARVSEQLPGCSVVCIEDYNKGVVSPRLAKAIVDLGRRQGIAVLVDPANIDDYTRYQGATMITPNRAETERVVGKPLRNIDAVRAAAADIHTACKTEWVCVTLDAEGAALIGP